MNFFDIKAIQTERLFLKKATSDMEYKTGTGKLNYFVSASSRSIKIRTQASASIQSISREKLRKAISYLFYKKTATRRELEKYSNMNSSLLGLLQRILIGVAKITKTAKGLLRITIKGVRFFFSGLDRATIDDLNAVVQNGGKYILCSYFYLREQNNKRLLEYIKKYDLQLLLDSGEFSAFKAKKKGKRIKPIKLKDYAKFITTFKDYIFGYFNMDVTGNPQKSKANYDKLKKLTGIPPIPIWHCDVEDWSKSNWQSLDELVAEDHGIIGIGATVHMGLKAGPRNMTKVKDLLFQEIFTRHPLQNFHWLGGSSKIMFKYPLFSSDSSGYLQGRKKKQVYYFDGEDISTRIDQESNEIECLSNNVSVLSLLEDMTLTTMPLSSL